MPLFGPYLYKIVTRIFVPKSQIFFTNEMEPYYGEMDYELSEA
jgi:hypothetical protein